MAYIATSSHEDALDILQDAMFTLASRYAEKTEAEWPALFHRILQNKIRDWYRRQTLKRRLFFWLKKDDDSDDIQSYQDESHLQPADMLYADQLSHSIEIALSNLPLRQQQTFLLRAWQGLSVKQVADALQISEGSVKTHYSRALESLRKSLNHLEATYDE